MKLTGFVGVGVFVYLAALAMSLVFHVLVLFANATHPTAIVVVCHFLIKTKS